MSEVTDEMEWGSVACCGVGQGNGVQWRAVAWRRAVLPVKGG